MTHSICRSKQTNNTFPPPAPCGWGGGGGGSVSQALGLGTFHSKPLPGLVKNKRTYTEAHILIKPTSSSAGSILGGLTASECVLRWMWEAMPPSICHKCGRTPSSCFVSYRPLRPSPSIIVCDLYNSPDLLGRPPTLHGISLAQD